MTGPQAERPRRPPLGILVAISALQPFALNVLAPATPGMARALATDYGTVQLTLTLYLAAVAVTQLVVGPISDRIGRRPCVLAGIALFMAGAAIGVASTSIEVLLAGRVVQAMGGGTCFALSRAIVRDTTTRDEAASLFGYITMAMVISPMIAPLLGGILDARFRVALHLRGHGDPWRGGGHCRGMASRRNGAGRRDRLRPPDRAELRRAHR